MVSLVVMGVSGSGKSTVGTAVAGRLHRPFIEGDDFHTAANRLKMRAGIALSDADRAEWLDILGERLALAAGGAVMTCSALKRSYRDVLRRASPGLRFAWLELDEAAASTRVASRGASHLFPATLVASQFKTLEPPVGEEDTLRLDALLPLSTLRDQIVEWMADRRGPEDANPLDRGDR